MDRPGNHECPYCGDMLESEIVLRADERGELRPAWCLSCLSCRFVRYEWASYADYLQSLRVKVAA